MCVLYMCVCVCVCVCVYVCVCLYVWGFPGETNVKESVCITGEFDP